MALIHGARGLIYFAHQFKPKFIEAGLLADEAMAREVAAINRQIHELAPVLNAPDGPGVATVVSSSKDVPIDILARRHAGATYVFSVAMRDGETAGTFTLSDKKDGRVEVLGEGRTIDAEGRDVVRPLRRATGSTSTGSGRDTRWSAIARPYLALTGSTSYLTFR